MQGIGLDGSRGFTVVKTQLSLLVQYRRGANFSCVYSFQPTSTAANFSVLLCSGWYLLTIHLFMTCFRVCWISSRIVNAKHLPVAEYYCRIVVLLWLQGEQKQDPGREIAKSLCDHLCFSLGCSIWMHLYLFLVLYGHSYILNFMLRFIYMVQKTAEATDYHLIIWGKPVWLSVSFSLHLTVKWFVLLKNANVNVSFIKPNAPDNYDKCWHPVLLLVCALRERFAWLARSLRGQTTILHPKLTCTFTFVQPRPQSDLSA